METMKPIKLSNQYLQSASSRVHAKIKNCIIRIDSGGGITVAKGKIEKPTYFMNSLNLDLPVISEEKLPLIIHKIDALDKLKVRLQQK